MINLPIDLSLVETPKLLISLEEHINILWECKYEPDKFFLIKSKLQKIINELKIREGGK